MIGVLSGTEKNTSLDLLFFIISWTRMCKKQTMGLGLIPEPYSRLPYLVTSYPFFPMPLLSTWIVKNDTQEAEPSYNDPWKYQFCCTVEREGELP